MDGQEQIGVLAIRDRRSFLERDELVRAARQHDFDARRLLEQLLEPQRDVEHQFRFGDAVGDGAGVVAAVAGIDDDLRDAQAELTGERVVAASGARRRRRRGLVRVDVGVGVGVDSALTAPSCPVWAMGTVLSALEPA